MVYCKNCRALKVLVICPSSSIFKEQQKIKYNTTAASQPHTLNSAEVEGETGIKVEIHSETSNYHKLKVKKFCSQSRKQDNLLKERRQNFMKFALDPNSSLATWLRLVTCSLDSPRQTGSGGGMREKE